MSYMFFSDLVIYILIFLAGLVAYVISTLSGGGGSLLLIPILILRIWGKSAASATNLGNFDWRAG